MTNQPEAIEVEVLEIDGVTTQARSESHGETPPQQAWQDWRNWQVRLRQLDSRWWPLWVFLGTIAVLLLLTVGLVIGIIFVILRILSAILRAIFR